MKVFSIFFQFLLVNRLRFIGSLAVKKSLSVWTDKLWRFSNSFRLMGISLGTLSNLGIGVILFMGLLRLVSGQITAGDFVLILGFVNSFFSRLFEIFFNLRDLTSRQVDLERYFQVLDKSVFS